VVFASSRASGSASSRRSMCPEFVLTYAFAGLFAFYISAASFLA
jgi:hypothetical protein